MKTKLPGMLAIFLGVFLCTGVAAASDVATLQPASDITYNENVTIKGSLNTDSLRVGTAGLGGVTFFNGTVLNEGPDPFTVGDDLRVDGYFYRMEVGPPNPIRVADSMVPALSDANDLGSDKLRWKKLYVKDADFTGSVDFTGANVSGITGFAAATHNHDSRYYTKAQSETRYLRGNTSDTMNGNLTINGNLNLTGDAVQSRTHGGFVKAAAKIKYSDDCGSTVFKEVNSARYFNHLDTLDRNKKIYCKKNSSGSFAVRFGEAADSNSCSIENRPVQVTIGETTTGSLFTAHTSASADPGMNIIDVNTYYAEIASPFSAGKQDNNFSITVF